ncbi:MAG TPA: acyl-CoA thioester hydrolase/BAAT C-terminal domain-containing protein [Blastocatellia bacterium]|nr:acyl-CoA thioester hydrolase/BAAT C-terminal domain-containing protein [Blastocatellia bacterium]
MRKRTYVLPFTLICLLAGAVSVPANHSNAQPAIHVSPETALIDEPVRIHLTGLAADESVTVRATTTDSTGRNWRSHAEFKANKDGAVDLSKQAPVAGTYSGVDAMGLFWSMDLIAGSQQAPAAQNTPQQVRVMSFEVEVAGKIVATTSITRLLVGDGVKSVDVRENGLVAKFFEPAKGGPFPAIMVLGGSEGGIRSAESRAGLLASHGYAALAVAYFGMEGLPQRLVSIPIEYLKKALDWMASQKNVDRKRLAVMGGSKGGELALLLASYFPELKAVVAYVPSSVAWPAIGGTGPSWTYQDKPVTYLPYKSGSMPSSKNGAMVLMPLYLASFDDQEAAKNASIAVEKINGSVLLISGKDDQLWPSSVMGDMVIARLKEKKHRFKYEHLSYDKAGHAIGTPYNPTTRSTSGGTLVLGGTAENNALAQADSWPKVLRFLKDNLTNRKQ